MVQDDTKIVTIPWDFKVGIPCLNFCVGDYVGGHHATNFLSESKDALENSKSFDTSLVIGE